MRFRHNFICMHLILIEFTIKIYFNYYITYIIQADLYYVIVFSEVLKSFAVKTHLLTESTIQKINDSATNEYKYNINYNNACLINKFR